MVHHKHVGEAVAGPKAHVANDGSSVCSRRRSARGDSVHLAGEQVNVVLDHVEPVRRRLQPCDPVHPDHPAQQRWQLQGMEKPTRAAVLGFGALAWLARSHVLSYINVLAHPKG